MTAIVNPSHGNVFLRFTEGCCWRRVVDVKLIENFFTSNGWLITADAAAADVIILETCAFVRRTEDISIDEINKIVESKYKGTLIVSGCLPGINIDRLREHFSGSVINTADLEDFNLLFPQFKNKLKLFDDPTELFAQKSEQSSLKTIFSVIRYFKDNFSISPHYWYKLIRNIRNITYTGMGPGRSKIRYLRVCWGCPEPHCTFCVEWKAVGSKVISKPFSDIEKEVRENLAEGVRHFAVIADNPATWGTDLGGNFTEMLSGILAVNPKIILSNLDGFHPRWLIEHKDTFLELIKTGRIRSMMSALQSGNNRILQLMNRGYTREEFISLMSDIRKANSRFVSITQIIVGFPTETFEEFKESVETVVECGCTNVTLFPFYCNPLTPAATLGGFIGDSEKKRRIEYALKVLGKNGILSFNVGVEINPKYQKVKAHYDQLR
ncbi:MAG: radical SAM protein [Fibrobacterota bacterium]|nr:radical SAM protein [Chitinispirillaceae bacterium]